MKNLLSIALILIFSYNLSSQVTIGSVVKKEEKIVLKPPTYDSLVNFTNHDNPIDYSQYIGLQFYLPPITNPTIGRQNNTENNFLFTSHPKVIKANNALFNSNKILVKPHYDSLTTFLYKPYHYYSQTEGNNKIGVSSDAQKVGNTYYTLLSVLYGDTVVSIYKTMREESRRLEKYKEDNVFIQYGIAEIKNGYSFPKILFLLKNNKNEDLLYCSNLKKLTLVPYFLKQKQIYEGKYIYCKKPPSRTMYHNDIITGKKIKINAGSKWFCKEVTLFKIDDLFSRKEIGYSSYNKDYSLYHKMTNDSNETIAINIMNGNIEHHKFILYDLYLKQEEEKKIALAALKEKERKEEQIRQKQIRVAKEKRKLECINIFGQANGELIAAGKVRIGMTKEMCSKAWGVPFWSNKTTTESRVYENWRYGFGYSLHFINGKLKRIEE